MVDSGASKFVQAHTFVFSFTWRTSHALVFAILWYGLLSLKIKRWDRTFNKEINASFGYSYFEKGCRKNCARDNPERYYGIWSMHFSWHCSCRTCFCCFLLALVNIRPWLLVPLFEIFLENSELEITHNTFWDCCVHFFRQPFLK